MQKRKKKLNHTHIPYAKINPKQIKNSNIKAKTINLLEKNIGENLCGQALSKDFLYTTLKTWHTHT